MSQLLTKHPNRNLKFKSLWSKSSVDLKKSKTSRTWKSHSMARSVAANRSDLLPQSKAILVASKTPSREEYSQF